MAYFDEWMVLIVINALAMISPGPDFVMAVRNSIMYSRKAGIFTAFGFATGISVHVAYCLIGIATLISQSILLFSIIKYAGAGYLIYVGIKALRSKGFDSKINVQAQADKSITNFAAFRSGFITNVLNPKATMTFMALFTQIIDPQTPLNIQMLYGLTCVVMTAGWFSIVALVLTKQNVRTQFLKFAKYIDRVCGALLVALGIKLATSKIAG